MINELIDAYLTSSPYPREPRANNRHWPSEAAYVKSNGDVIGKCIREQYFIRKQYPVEKAIAAHHIRKMDVGKAIELNEIKYAKECGIHVDDDVAFKIDKGDILISGKLDAVYQIDGEKVIVEYKTSDGYRFEQAVYGKYTRVKASPKPEHILQVMLYLEAFPDMKRCIIFYLTRSDMYTIEHEIKLFSNQAIVNDSPVEFNLGGIYKRYRELTYYLDHDELPPCDFNPSYSDDSDMEDLYNRGLINKVSLDDYINKGTLPGHWRCEAFCGYRNICTSMRDGDACPVSNSGVDNNIGAIVDI